MWLDNRLLIFVAIICGVLSDCLGFDGYVTVTNDGPTVAGGSIAFRADLYYEDGSRPTGTFDYIWRDNGIPSHSQVTESTKSTTDNWSVQYPADVYPVGEYSVQVVVRIHSFLWPHETSGHGSFKITSLLNGNMSVLQSNHSVGNNYVSTAMETEMKIDLRKGDGDYIRTNATELSIFWFVDCKYYGQTNDYVFHYNFSKADTTSAIEALIVASYDPLTTPAPSTTTTTTTPASNGTTSAPSNSTTTTTPKPVTTTKSPATTTAVNPVTQANTSVNDDNDARKMGLPFVCINSTIIPPDPKKTYGFFHKEVKVRAPIKNITVEGTNWIKPWDMLSLNVSCHGSGPFYKCLEYHRGHYNVTGNETCENGLWLQSCTFNITHYFLDPTVYTILMILKNDVSTQVYPLTINIYEVTAKPQLSVIVVPVSCSLAAVVLIVFGIAYYIQSRARFTVEVADFDFGQNNPELEYKTFTERLRDSFNSTGYKPLGNPKIVQN